MGLKKILCGIFLCVGLLFSISCVTSSDELSKLDIFFGGKDYDNYAFLDNSSKTVIDFYKLNDEKEMYEYQLSEDKTYYAIVGLSPLGKAILDFYENKIRQSADYLSVVFGDYCYSDNSISNGYGYFYNDSLNYDLFLPSSYKGLPIKELGENAFASIDFYSFHLHIPESITIFRRNCIRLNVQSIINNGYDLVGRDSPEVVLTASKVTWQIGEEELYLDPYAFVIQSWPSNMRSVDIILSDDNSKYYYEDYILYNKDKSVVYFGSNFDVWTHAYKQELQFDSMITKYKYKISYSIPEGIKEIKPGFMLTTSKMNRFNLDTTYEELRIENEEDYFAYEVNIPLSLEKASVDFFEYVSFNINKELYLETKYASTSNQINGFVFRENLGKNIIKVANGNHNFLWDDGVLYNFDKTVMYGAFLSKNIDSFEVPQTVKAMSSLVFFQNMKYLDAVKTKNVLNINHDIKTVSSLNSLPSIDYTNFYNNCTNIIKLYKTSSPCNIVEDKYDFLEDSYYRVFSEELKELLHSNIVVSDDIMFDSEHMKNVQNPLFVYHSKISLVHKEVCCKELIFK